jgi:hypothetical protein
MTAAFAIVSRSRGRSARASVGGYPPHTLSDSDLFRYGLKFGSWHALC